MNYIKTHKLFAAILSLAVIIILVISGTRGTRVINPAKNVLDKNPQAGISYALVYNQGELFKIIDNNDDTLRRIQEDLVTFARLTRPELKAPTSRVGFTFDKNFKKNNSNYTFTGHYYSVKDLMQITVTKYGKGIVKLSITNTKDGTNRDSSLNLNGPKNNLLTKLPIEQDSFSIRYSNEEDKIIVSFYKGYTNQDIENAISILKKEYGKDYNETNFIFNLNGIGNFTLQEVRNNLIKPIPG